MAAELEVAWPPRADVEREERLAARAPALVADAAQPVAALARQQLLLELWCPVARELEAWQLYWLGLPTLEVEAPPLLVDEEQVAVLAAGGLGRWGHSYLAGRHFRFLRSLAQVRAWEPDRWEPEEALEDWGCRLCRERAPDWPMSSGSIRA